MLAAWSTNAADTMAEQIKKFWQAHDPSGSIFAEAKELARLIFRKRKRVVPQDLWITGAAESGEKQHDTAVVSEIHMLQQMKDTLELRHEYLKGAGRELNHVLKNEKERQEFLKFAKDRYHSDPEQKELQQRDVEDGGNKKMHAGKHSRWSREMQRRCGDKTFWEYVSFTGAFNLAALAKIPRSASPERDPAKLCIQKGRTRAARRARERFRKAKSLKKRQEKGNDSRLSRQAIAMIRDLDNGKLRKDARRKTRESGYGRVEHKDGTCTDIGPHTGGRTRKVLDNWKPPMCPDSSDDEPETESHQCKEADAETESYQQKKETAAAATTHIAEAIAIQIEMAIKNAESTEELQR